MANVTYKVVKGDTLSGIAKAKGTTVNALLALNPDITDRNRIYVGQVIIISGTAAPKTTNLSQKAKITNFGLQSDTTRTVFATWAWDKKNTDHYEVKWMYSTGDGVGFIGTKADTTDKQSVYNAPENANHVAFYVRPISKTYKTKKKDDVKYWNADWSTVKRYYFIENPGVPPKAESANITVKNLKLTITLNNLASLKADSVQFQILRDNNAVFKNGTSKISNNKASYSCTLEAGKQYVVKSRSIKGTLKSEWSAESDTIFTSPAASDGIYSLYALTETSVSLNWYDVSGVDSYEVQYTAVKRYFDSNPSAVQSVTVESVVGHAEITGLTTGQQYFFRVRTIKGTGDNSKGSWTEIKSITLGTKPSVPTTWSSTSTIKVGDTLNLYWMHNSEDGSRLMKSQLELIIDGVTQTKAISYGTCGSTDNLATKVVSLSGFVLADGVVIKVYMSYVNTGTSIKLNVNDTGAKDVKQGTLGSLYWPAGSLVTFTYTGGNWVLTEVGSTGSAESYSIDTTQYTEGTTIQWRVKTAGRLKASNNTYVYSDWSEQRMIDVYAPPTVLVNITDHSGDIIEELTSFPFNIAVNSAPNTQTPIGYFISITANESYEDIDDVGNTILVGAGSEVYYKKIDSSDHRLDVPISASDVNLKNNVTYKVAVTVGMNSGLSGESSEEFTVSMEEPEYWPDAEIVYDEETYTASIRPYCESANGVLISGITLSVYRREFDGSFTELATGIDNTERTYVNDPHPSLDYARYRIVATDSSSGSISYYDVPGYPIEEKAVIIQWDEKWQNYDLTDDKSYEMNGITYVDELDQPAWSGSLVRLPYNIDISDDNQVDVSLINYIGRKHPVSYYGTQLGSTSSWAMEIPKEDIRTLYALRRLSVWTGDVYVREPSGSGYWANISLSFSQRHKELTIPITITITRVEGGK